MFLDSLFLLTARAARIFFCLDPGILTGLIEIATIRLVHCLEASPDFSFTVPDQKRI